jgi:HSP20 family protein
MVRLTPYRRSGNGLVRGDDYFNHLVTSLFNNDFFAPVGAPATGQNHFRVDIKETDASFILEADLPGVNKDDIDITYENNYLTISAKKETSSEESNEKFIRQERTYGEFSRSFYVDGADGDQIGAAFNDGVLKVTVAKVEPKVLQKKIEIQ